MIYPFLSQDALAQLTFVLATCSTNAELTKMVESRQQVLTQYQPLFASTSVDLLTAETFRDFLIFRNNKHWTGLQRLGPAITQDMTGLKDALRILLDESIPIDRRLDILLPNGTALVKKLGKAVLTPILLVAYPDKYGVWNGTSEGAMRTLGLWPDFEGKISIGQRYVQLNQLMLSAADKLGIDLWTLDALWWRIIQATDETFALDEELPAPEVTGLIRFGLERHLHDFLFDNWPNTSLGVEWNLYEEGGDIKGYGYERPTPVGRIDLLAYHKSEPRWLVIELKRNQATDETLGQLQRYMGWVLAEVAQKGERVEGLIIALEEDVYLRYALKSTVNIRFMRYVIDFRLEEKNT